MNKSFDPSIPTCSYCFARAKRYFQHRDKTITALCRRCMTMRSKFVSSGQELTENEYFVSRIHEA